MALPNYKHSAAERLMRYVQIDTQSDPASESQPSTEKQKDLSRLLVKELKALGVADAELDEHGYVYATVEASAGAEGAPTICLCAHVDTSPDSSGKDVKPILHKAYAGKDMVLPDDPSVVITAQNHPYLHNRLGDDIITASGKTLLGADDKAGVAVIMDTVAFLMANPAQKRCKIRVLFTPDEEIGRGVAAVDMEKLGADFGYTLDGGERGHLEGETFSADAVTITFNGVSAHPGYAKGKLVSAIKVAAHFVDALPKDGWSPETTEGYEGFVHPTGISGTIEKATLSFIIRDFQTEKLRVHEEKLQEILAESIKAFPGCTADFDVQEQYRNMKSILDDHPHVMALAEKAYRKAGMEPLRMNVRGGTDGSRLSFMGLPCPNIFTGEMGIHSRQEYVSVQDMEKAVEVCVHLAALATEKTKEGDKRR